MSVFASGLHAEYSRLTLPVVNIHLNPSAIYLKVTSSLQAFLTFLYFASHYQACIYNSDK